jgi:ABC-type Fe3+-hydroxamate transport system substrate-binding protein
MRDLHDIRIASLVPSLTELAVELGLGENLVARTGFCVHPAAGLRKVPKVGGTKDVNLAKLRQLAPTHVLLNVDENRLETVEALQAMGVELVVTHPLAPQDNLALVDQFAAVFGRVAGVADRAARLRQALEDELARTGPQGRPVERVLYLIWHGPWMTVARDTYISRMLAAVNWQTLPEQPGGERGAARYPVVHGDEPWLREIDRVLLSSEPFRFADVHQQQAQALCAQARVQRVDGELLSWYGARAVPGLRYLRDLAST